MIQLILHVLGDYILQNDWMAQNKTKKGREGELACLTHTLLYTIPFVAYLMIVHPPGDPDFLLFIPKSFIIGGSHYLIDRNRLAVAWIAFFNGNWKTRNDNFGYGPNKPKWMAFWLMVAIDNSFHLIINYIVITA